MGKLQAIAKVAFFIMNVPSHSFRSAKPSVIEPDCFCPFQRINGGNMCSLADIRIVAVQHKNHSLDSIRGRV